MKALNINNPLEIFELSANEVSILINEQNAAYYDSTESDLIIAIAEKNLNNLLVSGERIIKPNIENDIISYLKKHVIFDDFQVIGESNQPKALFILGDKRVEVVPGEINLSQPTEIDVLLHGSNGSTYIVYILEVTGEIMHATLKDIVLLASDYFRGNYQVKERRGLFKKDHYLEFSLPIINNIAVKSKHTKLRSIST